MISRDSCHATEGPGLTHYHPVASAFAPGWKAALRATNQLLCHFISRRGDARLSTALKRRRSMTLPSPQARQRLQVISVKEAVQSPRLIRFENFEVNLRSGELRRSGEKVKLPDQSFQILAMLLEQPGEVVMRPEIQKRLWPKDTVVEFENSINAAVKRLRLALGDSEDQPRYIETLARRGYRWMVPVERVDAAFADARTTSTAPATGAVTAKRAPRNTWLLISGAPLALLLITAIALWTKPQPSTLPNVTQRQLTANSTENPVSSGAISPEGRDLAYADLKGIHVKLLETGEIRTIPQPEDFKGLHVSWNIIAPWVDGSRFVAGALIRGQQPSVWLVRLTGEAPRKLRDEADPWSVSRDGAWVAFGAHLGRVGYRELWVMRSNGEHAHKIYELDENSGFGGAEWSPDGQRLSYGKWGQVGETYVHNIESRDLEGGAAVTAMPDLSRHWDWWWSPDGRMIQSLDDSDSVAGNSCNFWEVRVDTRTGQPSRARRLTDWAGFCMGSLGSTADSRHFTFRKWSWQGSVYVADFEASGTRLHTPRHLTMNEGRNYPAAWTADSKAIVFGSYRDGKWGIFKQSLQSDTAQVIVTGLRQKDVVYPRISPDGAWVLYPDLPIARHQLRFLSTQSTTSVPLIRVPIAGGTPQIVLTTSANVFHSLGCAKSPASLCVIAEWTADNRQLVFTGVDPVKGRGRELARFDTNPSPDADYVWDLSPDGTRIAFLKQSEGRIHVLNLTSGSSNEIVVKGWSAFQSVNWAADGKGLLVSSLGETGSTLLLADLHGNAHSLWEQQGNNTPWTNIVQPLGGPSVPWGVPSPDGRHLAIYNWTFSGNMWMMENF